MVKKDAKKETKAPEKAKKDSSKKLPAGEAVAKSSKKASAEKETSSGAIAMKVGVLATALGLISYM